MSEAYKVVQTFERAIADWVGAEHGVAVDCCSNALFLAMLLAYRRNPGDGVARMPARTFLSVPIMAKRAGWRVKFIDFAWQGQYGIALGSDGNWVSDSAGQLARGSFPSGTMCVSFQFRKPVPIGRGGMILTNNASDADWYRRMRYLGRDPEAHFDFNRITEMGYNMVMTPEQAARGLTLLELSPPTRVFASKEYTDLRDVPIFKE